MDNPKLLRKINLSLILITCQLILIVTFGGGWTYYSYGIEMRGSALIPFPPTPWYASTTAVILYITLVFTFLYIAWLIAQVVVPDRIPLDLKSILFVDMIVSGVLSILLIFAFSFYAGGFGANNMSKYMSLGYSFWLCVIAAITGVGSMISAGLGWFRS